MPAPVIFIGQKYGHLLVLDQVGRKDKDLLWKCQCDCGDIRIYSTRQLRSPNRDRCDKCKGIDLTGQRFGKLVVLEKTSERRHNSVVWKCQCDCGNIHYASQQTLKAGKTQSCGCSRKEAGEKMTIDLLGQRFGKLTVIEKTNERKDNSVVWKCLCDCGNITFVDSNSLRRGNTQSCGCLKSKGELKLIEILKNLGIDYEYQKTFDTCNNEYPLAFDFYLPLYNLCIEYDGAQHTQAIKHFGGEARLKQQQVRDEIKNQWCKSNNIDLIRIPYTDYDKLDTRYIEEIIEQLRGKVQ